MPTPRELLAEYIASASLTMSEFSRLVGLAPSTISKFLSGERPLGELASLKIEQGTRDAYVTRRVKIPPLDRASLRPRRSTKARAAA
jgi:transcriptional regulator with XRE-family HTH domain